MATLVLRTPHITATFRELDYRADLTSPTITRQLVGELTIMGATVSLEADSPERMRLGITAKVAQVAKTVKRPVRLSVQEADGSGELAVHPDGFVQTMNVDGTVDEQPEARPISETYCRSCRRFQPIGNKFCIQCGEADPFSVEAKKPL